MNTADPNDFTGLDLTSARMQINDFATTGNTAETKLATAIDEFFTGLSDKWASPNAVEFCKTYQNKLYDSQWDFSNLMYHKIYGANYAARVLAAANGAHWNDVDNPFADKPKEPITIACKESKDLITGMATENVKNLRDVFIGKMSEVFKTMDSIPREIGFYSPDGTLVNAYKTEVENIQVKLEEDFTSLCDDIKKQMETEINNIKLAKEEAEAAIKAVNEQFYKVNFIDDRNK